MNSTLADRAAAVRQSLLNGILHKNKNQPDFSLRNQDAVAEENTTVNIEVRQNPSARHFGLCVDGQALQSIQSPKKTGFSILSEHSKPRTDTAQTLSEIKNCDLVRKSDPSNFNALPDDEKAAWQIEWQPHIDYLNRHLQQTLPHKCELVPYELSPGEMVTRERLYQQRAASEHVKWRVEKGKYGPCFVEIEKERNPR